MKALKLFISFLVCTMLVVTANKLGIGAEISIPALIIGGLTVPQGVLMSITPGVFSETILYPARVKMTAMLLNTRVKQQYQPKADILKALARVSTAKLKQLDDSTKDYEVELEWFNACGLEVDDFTSCEFGGDKGSTNIQKYTLEYDHQVSFSISEADFTNNDFGFQESLAQLMLRADKNLIEDYAQYTVSVLNANKGVNAYTTGIGEVCGSDTYVQAVSWSSNLLAYFLMTANLNRFENPILIDGGNLFQAYTNAKFNSGNDDGKGAIAAFNSMEIYFDLFNLPIVNGDSWTDYIVETGSLSWANKTYFTNEKPELGADQVLRWHQGTRFTEYGIPLYYDVAAKASCTTNNLTSWDYTIRLKADVLVNPTGCDTENTGILTMICGECPD